MLLFTFLISWIQFDQISNFQVSNLIWLVSTEQWSHDHKDLTYGLYVKLDLLTSYA